MVFAIACLPIKQTSGLLKHSSRKPYRFLEPIKGKIEYNKGSLLRKPLQCLSYDVGS